MKRLILACCVPLFLITSSSLAQLTLRADVTTPSLNGFRPLPAEDAAFTSKIEELVKRAGLDAHTSAEVNPDKEEEWASICVVDLADPAKPRVGSWNAQNFVYPASAYKMYVVGEAIRQVCAGERSLDDLTTVAPHNVRGDSRLTSGQLVSLSEVLRLTCQYSDNTAANVAIDTVDRQRASALLRAMGCTGSDITRKFLPRTREDAEYTSAPGMTTCAHHFATFLWAVEQGAIGGGRGRGLIKGYLATNVDNKDRIRAGVPASATVFSKTGEWDTFTSDVGMVEEGNTRYIVCIMTAMEREQAAPKMAAFVKSVHDLLRGQQQ